MRVKKMAGALLFLCLVIALFLYAAVALLGDTLPQFFGWSGTTFSTLKFAALCILFGVVFIGLLTELLLNISGRNAIHKQWGANAPLQLEFIAQAVKEANPYTDLQDRLRSHLGSRWGRRTRILLVCGEERDVEKLFPSLIAQRWIEGAGNLLLWIGATNEISTSVYVRMLPHLRRYRPADAVVWVTDDASIAKADTVDSAMNHFHRLYAIVGWQLPVYLWDMQTSGWGQSERPLQSVGCFLPEKPTATSIAALLGELIAPLRQQGIRQLQENIKHDFLLRLSHRLNSGVATTLSKALGERRHYVAPVRVAGMMFSLPTDRAATYPHSWIPDARWTEMLAQIRANPCERNGIKWNKWIANFLLVVMLIWSIGAIATFAVNRHEIMSTAALLDKANDSGRKVQDRLLAQYALQQKLTSLLLAKTAPAPWYSAFGLNIDDVLLPALLRHYTGINHALIMERVLEELLKQLQIVATQSASPATWQQNYDALKAYLMISQPDHVDPKFLSDVMIAHLFKSREMPEKEWQSLSTSLTLFYAEQLRLRPDWAESSDAALVQKVRTVLLSQLAGQNSDGGLYRALIHNASRQYAELSLASLTGSEDAEGLFNTSRTIPGAYSREAWESAIEPELEQLRQKRAEQIGWVLSDGVHPVTGELSPEAVTARLKERYFSDFAAQWNLFLNSLRWNKAPALAATLKQLSIMTDARRSPLNNLMDKLSVQLQAGATRIAETEEDLVYKGPNSYRKARLAPKWQLPEPMLTSFGPALGFMGIHVVGNEVSGWNFKSYLSQVSRLQQKLQQVSQSSDPRVQAQGLGNTVLRGTAIDLPDSKAFVDQLTMSLGKSLRPFSQSLFLNPMNLSWRQVLAPSGTQINKQWQTEISAKWHTRFADVYPFAPGKTDLSLSDLSLFIRPDTGLIDRFISDNLQGVLRKEAGKWVPDSAVKGIRFNPAFIAAINRLNDVSQVLYGRGDQQVEFDLLPVPSRDVVQTELKIDGQSLIYFNQMPVWQNFAWPVDVWGSYSELVWTSIKAGARIYYSAAGNMSFIRLLDTAKVTQLAPQLYQIDFTVPDGSPLKYQIRTAEGEGPLVLLKLKGFDLPDRIFNTK